LIPAAPKLILVPTDFSAPAAHALRYAAALAERFTAHLLVIHADTFVPPVDFTITAAGSFDLSRESLMEATRERLQSFAETNIPTDVPYDVQVLIGDAAGAIAHAARHSGANLIVMGTHGRSGFLRLLAGSVTEQVMRCAPVPVLAVNGRSREDARLALVLGQVAASRECRMALRQAAVLAGTDAQFLLFGASGMVDRAFTMDDMHLLDVCTPSEIRDRAGIRVFENEDASVILTAARSAAADLIVLGISGERTLTEVLRGTVAERVAQQSRCPVLTVNTACLEDTETEVDVREPALIA
jgi:nucleotide-binding universal stress UspA family protein